MKQRIVLNWGLLATLVLVSGALVSGCSSTAKPDTTPGNAGANSQEAVSQEQNAGSNAAGGSDSSRGDFVGAAAGNTLAAMQNQADQLADQLSIDEQRKIAEAKAKTEAAKTLMNELRYKEAEDLLRQAVALDPKNEEARKQLDTVLFVIGDRRGVVRNVADEEAERERVRRQAAEVELKRSLVQGRRELDDRNFDEAARIFEQVLENIEWYHYKEDLGDLKSEAQGLLAQAQNLRKSAEAENRAALEKLARDDSESERIRSVTLLQNEFRRLLKKAKTKFDNREYEQAILLTNRILDRDANHSAARRLNREARRLYHLYEVTRARVRSAEEWDNAFLLQLESEIPYEQIFNFPSQERWNDITRKAISIEARLLGETSSEEQAIKIAMQQPLDVDFKEDPLPGVIDFLHTVSGINFVFTKEGSDVAADIPVNLNVKNLPLENILNLVLGEGDTVFNWMIRDSAVLIGPASSLRSDLFLEFYAVSDVTTSPPEFPAPKLALEPPGADEGGGGGGVLDLGEETETSKTSLPIDALVDILTKAVSDENGDVDGGEGSVEPQGSRTIVARVGLENHKKIQRVLESLRKSTGIMVTVETRFIDLQDNFLQTVGVDFGNPFSSNLPNTISDIDGNGTQISAGFEMVDSQGQTDVRAALFNGFSLPLGTSVAPFELTDRGGFALQYNVLDTYILEAILEANEKEQRYKKLDAPRVTAFNTQTAHSLIVEQAAYIKDVEVNQTGVIPVINPVIGILNTGSILEVKPTVSHDRKYVVLEIRPTLATQLPSRFKNLTLGFTNLTVEFPVLSVTRVNTTITVPDGGTVLVGGLKRTITEEARAGLPWLHNLPFFDILGGRKGESRLQSNIFVLINAKITVIRDEERSEFN